MNWHLVHTKPRQEKQADAALQRVGVEVFHPRLMKNKMIRRKEQTIIAPLFPGYLFARFNLETHYRAVHYARGVQNLVSFGSDLAIVEDEVIESIRSRMQNGYVALPPPSFTQGQIVRIQKGPFEGLDAIFEREMSDHQRVMLLFQELSFQGRMIVDIGDVVNL